MSNALAHGLAVLGKDVVKGIVWLPEHLAQAVKVVEDAVKDEPAVRDELKTLVKKVIALESLVAVDVAAKGMNIPGDLEALSELQDLLSFIRGEFLHVMTQAYHDVEEDLEPSPA